MARKKILIISASFYPEISPRSFRTTELVKEFARQGHDVTLLTVKNDEYHITFEQQHGVKIKDMGALVLPPINFVSGNRLWLLTKRVIRRLLLMLLEYPAIEYMFRVKSALRNENGYDLLISIAVPHPIHWGVAWSRTGSAPIAATWVADCGDPYMGMENDPWRCMPYFGAIEKWFCTKADYVTVPIESAKRGYYPEFREKIKVIPQGFKFDDIVTDKAGYTPHPIPTFAYAGAFIPGGRDPRNLLNYLVNQKTDFKFIIYTTTKAMITPYIEKAQGRFEIRDYVPRDELLQSLTRMDFLMNINNVTELQMPSKLIDYYLTGRPVLSLDSGQVDEEKIKQFLAGNYHGRLQYDNVEQYRIENVCRQFLDLIPG